MSLSGVLLFHLNLSYSSIEVEEQPEVVERCYRPLLGLLHGRPWLRLALEASGHTLERIEALAPDWIAGLRGRVASGQVELVGSGDTQLIGPLVPASVNRWNQELGQRTYERLLGVRPDTALVAEMAWSQGIVDCYLDAGYRRLLMEWNNPRRRHAEWPDEWRYRPARTASPAGRTIDVCWIDTTAFQKFQRTVAGELELDVYLEWVRARVAAEPRALFLYASDAEIFDFRPGRYAAEPRPASGEWERIGEVLDLLHDDGVPFRTPVELAREPCWVERPSVILSSAADPIPVKKQPKYNVSRWAVSGWDDLGLNTHCFALARRLEGAGASERDWRALVRLWASDHRTHLTRRRWDRVWPARPARAMRNAKTVRAAARAQHGRIELASRGVELALNPRRGLAVEACRFPGVAAAPLFGTLPHGHFDDIELTADFYTGHTVVEIPGDRRITDLEPCEPLVERSGEGWRVSAVVPTALGPLAKTVAIGPDHVELGLGLAAWGERPLGSVRTAIVTLLPEMSGAGLCLETCNGGAREVFAVDAECDHGGSVSPLVSAGAGFGATDGRILLRRGETLLELAWEPSACAALPLLTCREVEGKRLVRVAFSLSEVDETHRPGARLYDFCLTLRARKEPQ